MYNVHIVVAEATQRLITTSLGGFFCVAIMLKSDIVTTQNWNIPAKKSVWVSSDTVAVWMTDKFMYFRTVWMMPCYKANFSQKIKKAPAKKVAPLRLLGAFAPFSDQEP